MRRLAKCLRTLHRPTDAAYHRRRCWELETIRDGGDAVGTLETALALAEDLKAAGDEDAARVVAMQALKALTSEDAGGGVDGHVDERTGIVTALRRIVGGQPA